MKQRRKSKPIVGAEGLGIKTRTESASALIAVLLVLTVLLTLSGAALVHTTNRRMTMNQTGTWQEALAVAEAGVHEGLAQLNNGIQGYSGTNVYFLSGSGGVVSGSSGFSISLSHAVEVGGGQVSVTGSYTITGTTYQVSSLVAGSGTQAEPYYRIRSTGQVVIPGARSLSSNSADVILRKLNLMGPTQTATRTIEVWIKPQFQYVSGPLVSDELISFNNKGIFVDSFDSTDPNRSVNGQPNSTAGFYNLPPYNDYSANVYTNYSGQTQLGGAYIYGSVSTNGGTISGGGNIQPSSSNTYNNFSTDLQVPTAPSWGTNPVPTSPLPVTSIDTTGYTATNHLHRAYTAINGNLTLSSTGSAPTYIDIYVSGDITLNGGSSIVIGAGVHATFYIGGNITISGGGSFNTTANPTALALTLIGVNPVSQDWKLCGNGALDALVYAPNANITLDGGGNSGTFVGSITGKTITANGGNVEVRYDEALGKMGTVLGFKIAAWFEDTKNNNAP